MSKGIALVLDGLMSALIALVLLSAFLFLQEFPSRPADSVQQSTATYLHSLIGSGELQDIIITSNASRLKERLDAVRPFCMNITVLDGSSTRVTNQTTGCVQGARLDSAVTVLHISGSGYTVRALGWKP